MGFLDRFFKISERNSSVRTEIIAGLTTFITMAYIIFVQPTVLSAGGMDFGAVLAATCISSALASIMMGLYANYPIALAPAMGENIFFTFTVIIAMGIPWNVALGIIFISGVLFLLLTFFNVRELMINAIPMSLKSGIAVGIGLFIAFIGLVYGGIIVKDPGGGVLKLGDVKSLHVLLPLIGLLIIGILSYLRVKGAMLIGMAVITLIALPFGIVQFHGVASAPPSISPTLLKMDLAAAISPQYFPLILVFLFMTLFDTVGTVVGVTQQAGLMKEDGSVPKLRQILMTDATATVAGAALGTSTVVTYIESSAGVQEGGRTGLTAVVAGLMFILALFFEPLAKMLGGGYSPAPNVSLYPVIAPALIFVGAMLMRSVTRIDFSDLTEALPAFLVIVGMPLTYSIADGLAFGFIAYPIIKLFTGRVKEVHPIMHVMGIIFILRYAFL